MTRMAIIPVALLLMASPLGAQEATGEIYGTVTGPAGTPLPGVTLELTGMGAPRLQMSGDLGQFRFLKLDPGSYGLSAALDGFGTAEYSDIDLHAGRSVTLAATMGLEVRDAIVVTAATVLLDQRRIRQGATITGRDLEKIPTGRDPWSLLSQAPGVLIDRINVGGNESGLQSKFVGTGAGMEENTYSIDGVNVTSGGQGLSMLYYDFDSLTEVNLVTGGSDTATETPGVTVNMVTKRGTNTWRGTARVLTTGSQWQSSPNIGSGDFGDGQEDIPTNEIRSIYEYGLEGGGPIVQDKAWIWAGWATNDVKLIAAGGTPDNTLLENTSIKLNSQLSAANSLVLSFGRSAKIKAGFGAGPDRAPETTWNQDYSADIWKIEDSHLVSRNLLLTGFYSDVPLRNSMASGGGAGAGAPEALWDSDGVFKRNFVDYQEQRTARQAQLEATWFLASGKTDHSITLAGRRREVLENERLEWPGGRQLLNISGNVFGLPEPLSLFALHRGQSAGTSIYDSVWAQDTLSRANWTLNLGLRFDRQRAKEPRQSIPANPVRPDIFPALEIEAGPAPFSFEDVQPRVGLTYALGPQKTTLLRLSLSRFVERLGTRQSRFEQPTGGPSSILFGPIAYFVFVDLNGDNIFDDGEPNFLASTEGFDPLSPGTSPNRADPGLEAERTDELILGVEHQLAPQLVAGLALTYRSISRIQERRTLVHDFSDGSGDVRVASRDDYVPSGTTEGTLPNGQPYEEEMFSLSPDLLWTGGSQLTNGDREQDYKGVSLTFTKRLQNRWMARGYVNWSEWEWSLGPEFRRYDDPNDLVGSQDNDGNVVAHFDTTGGIGKDYVYFNSGWSFNLNGMVELAAERPWGFNLAGNLTGREGYPLAYFASTVGTDGIPRDIQITGAIDSYRNNDPITLDLRVEKQFSVGDIELTVGVDAFNILNDSTVLRRTPQMNGPRPNFLEEVLSPRIFRLGVRIAYR